MSASMRSTLQTVPESVPADHVTNSKILKKILSNLTPTMKVRPEPLRKESMDKVLNLKHNNVKSNKKRKRVEQKICENVMVEALNAISVGQSIRIVANRFNIPKSTLNDKLKHYSAIDCKKGPSTTLSDSEEVATVDWIIYCSERGFPITKVQLLDCVEKYLKDKKRKIHFKNKRPSKHWYKAFMKRHESKLSLRTAHNLTSTRASVTEDNLRKWFSHVRIHLEKNNLIQLDAQRVFNLDETAFMLVPKDQTVLARKGARSVYQIVGSSEKANLTVLITAAASGELAPPMVLYDLKTAPRKNILENIPKGWGVGHTERGWMTAESFYSYITNVFFKWLKDKNYQFPVILYVDGHASHLTLPLCIFCKKNGIELIALHPNATHIIQPLDVAFFHPFKDQYKKILRQWKIENNILDFKKSMLAIVLKIVLEKNDFSTSIRNGFKTCGLYPFDATAINYDIFKKSKKINSLPNTANISKNDDNVKLLQLFESKLISPEILKEFKDVSTHRDRLTQF